MKEYVKEAKRRRRSGNHTDDGSLVGFCFDNSYVLYNVLEENGFEPQIVCGTTKSRLSSKQEQSISKINSVTEIVGSEHFWIECNGYILDVATDEDTVQGGTLITQSLPDSYYRFSDSYIYAEQILDGDVHYRRCDYCGGRNGHCECPNETNLS